MGRPKTWEAIVRDLCVEEGMILVRVVKLHTKIVRQIGTGEHIKDPEEFLANIAALGHAIGKVEALSQASSHILENNNRTAADIEREAIRRTYRHKGRTE